MALEKDLETLLSIGRLFENQEIESLQVAVARENGFYLTGHVLELYGICSKCQAEGFSESEKENNN